MSDEPKLASGAPRSAIWCRLIEQIDGYVKANFLDNAAAGKCCEDCGASSRDGEPFVHDQPFGQPCAIQLLMQSATALRACADAPVVVCEGELPPAPDAVGFHVGRPSPARCEQCEGPRPTLCKSCADALASDAGWQQCVECGCRWSHPDQALCPRCLALGTAIHYEQLKSEAADRIRALEAALPVTLRADALAPPSTESDNLAHDAKVQAVHLRLTQRANELHSAHVTLEEAAEEIVDLQDQVADALAPAPDKLSSADRQIIIDALYDRPIGASMRIALIERLDATLRADALAPPEPNEICICAAIQFADGRIVRGHRHDSCFRTAEGWTPKPPREHVQGFITSRNRFVDRHEGARLQNEAGLISAMTGHAIEGYSLFSEDLYFDKHDHAAMSAPPRADALAPSTKTQYERPDLTPTPPSTDPEIV